LGVGGREARYGINLRHRAAAENGAQARETPPTPGEPRVLRWPRTLRDQQPSEEEIEREREKGRGREMGCVCVRERERDQTPDPEP